MADRASFPRDLARLLLADCDHVLDFYFAGIRSLLAAVLGYLILLLVLEAGKVAFGKKRIRLDAPTPFTWKRRGDDADFVVGSEQSLWSDHFAREKDRLLLQCGEARIDNHTYGNVTLEFHHDRVVVEGNEFVLDNVTEISGVVHELQIGKRVWSAKLPFGPYLAFGALSWMFFGDAFLRWYAGLFNP